MRWSVAALLLLLTPNTTRYLRAAAAAYDSLDYERALEQIHHARADAQGVEDDTAIALYEGVILADMGRSDEARDAFRAALMLEPNSPLPARVSPKVVALFDSVRAEVNKRLAAEPPALRASAPPPPAPSVWPERAAFIAGGVFLVLGGAGLGDATALHQQLASGTFSSASGAQSAASQGKLIQTLGWTGLALGVASAGVGVAWWATSGKTKVSVGVGPGSAAVEVRF
jgi:hypothetical protein